MEKEEGLACLGLAVLGVVAVVVVSITNGWALSVLWGWFVTPIFGITAPTIPMAIGFSLVVGMFSSSSSSSDKEKSTGQIIGSIIGVAIFRPAFAVFMGWVILSFV